jgi:GNAT superfamily N-acetyltransferase
MELKQSILDGDRLGQSEIDLLVDLVNAAFRRHAWLFPVDRTDRDGFRGETAKKNLLLLEAGGEPAAMAVFETMTSALRFGMAVVSPSFQARGLGKRLVALLEQHARSLGLTTVELETVREIGNEDYYLGLGYVTDLAETRPVGTWGALQTFTLVHMHRSLETAKT